MSRLRLFLSLLPLALAPLFSQTTTLNLSTQLVSLGIASSNMLPNQSTVDSGPLFEAGVKYAASHKMTLVTASTGAYYFLNPSGSNSTVNLTIGPISTPMTIDLQGSDLYFNHPELGGLLLVGLTNVTLENFTTDFIQQVYTQIQITAVNAAQRQLQFTVQPGWQSASSLNALYPLLDPTGANDTSLLVFRNGQPIVDLFTLVSQPLTDGLITLTSSAPATQIAEIQPGDTAVLYLRGNGGLAVFANKITGCTLRNIKIYSGNVGFRSVSQSSTLLERVEVVPRPGTTRLISSIADGIDPAYFGTGNVVKLCRAIRTCDDAFAPNTFVFASVQSVLGPSSIQVEGDSNTLYFNGGYALPNGSNVAFQSATTGAILGTAVVVSQAPAASINGLSELVLNFNQTVPSNLVGAFIYATDANGLGSGLLMERNTVQQHDFANGFDLWGLINTTIYGNYIHRASWAGMLLQNHLLVAWISPPTVNMNIVNNVVDGTATQYLDSDWALDQLAAIQITTFSNLGNPVTQSPNQNISLTGNFIANPGRSAIWFGNTTGGSANANYLFDPNNSPNPPNSFPNTNSNYTQFASQAFQPLVSEASQNISFGTNPIDQASGRAFVTDTSYNELAAYAPGSTIQLNAVNLGTLAGPAVSLTDADGTSWPLTVVATATHSVDVLLPPNIALGGAVVTLNAGAATYLGTLFVDAQDNIPAINQATFLISPSATTVPAQGGTVSFLVVTQPGNSYTATDPDSFVTAGTGGTGTGIVTLTVSPRTGSGRTTTVTIAGQPFVVAQAGSSDPVIVTQPQSQTVVSGAAAVFTVAATGATGYQWYLNGTALTGATGTTLMVPAATTSNVGTYTAVATNASASTTSSAALLSVPVAVPSIAFHPQNQIANAGSTVSFSVTPAVSAGLAYQWTLNDTTISGATGSSLTLTNVQAANAGTYAVVVTTGAGGSITNLATLAIVSGGPSFTIQPVSQTIVSGTTVVFSAAATGGSSTGYQWDFNGHPIAGATSARLVLTGATAGNGGTYVCVATASGVSTTSSPATLAFTGTTNVGRLINLSVNTTAGPSPGQVLTVGFVIGGPGASGSQNLLIRADGPALGALGVPNTIADPYLAVYNGSTVVASNDNWGTPASNIPLVTAADSATFAFPLNNSASLDAALVTPLPITSGYTVQVSNNVSASGTVLAELYDDTPSGTYSLSTPRLINLSARNQVGANQSLTAGFSIGGTTSKTLLIRATGPALAVAPFNLSGTMPDPQLALHTSVNGQDTVLATNAGWGGDPQITAAANSVFAFPLNNPSSADSVLLVTLPPGVYTAVASSASGVAGVVLVEVYEVP